MSTKGKQAMMSLGDFLEDHPTPPHGETGTSSGVEPPDDGEFVFITAEKPAAFKSKSVMTTVRKSAMERFLAYEKPPADSPSTRRKEIKRSNTEMESRPNLYNDMSRGGHVEPNHSLNDPYEMNPRFIENSLGDDRFSRDNQFSIAEPKKRRKVDARAVALFDFAKENENELRLDEGQKILVLYDYGGGWLWAQDLETYETGFVPEAYTQLINDGMTGAQMAQTSAKAVRYESPSPELSRPAFQTRWSPVTYQGNTSESFKKWKEKPPTEFQRPLPSVATVNPPCNTLRVGNLPMETSEDEVKALFSKQQGYKRLCLRTKKDGPICFVEFEDVSFAEKALNGLYGYMLHSSTGGGIELSYSKNPLGVRSGQVSKTPGRVGVSSNASIIPNIHQVPPARPSNRPQYLADDSLETGMKLNVNDISYSSLLSRFIYSNSPDYDSSILISLNDGAAERVATIAGTLGKRFARIHQERRHTQTTQQGYTSFAIDGDLGPHNAILIDFSTGGLPDNLDTFERAAQLLKKLGSPRVCAFITHGTIYRNTYVDIVASQVDRFIVTKSNGRPHYMRAKLEVLSRQEGSILVNEALPSVHFVDKFSSDSAMIERNIVETDRLGKHKSDIEPSRAKPVSPNIVAIDQEQGFLAGSNADFLEVTQAYQGRESAKAEPTDIGESSVSGNNRPHTPSSPSSVSGFSEAFDIDSVSDNGGGIALPTPTDVKSENNLSMANEGDVLTELKDAHIEADFSSNDEEQEHRYLHKKRWSVGVLKRSHSYSELVSSCSEPESQGDEALKSRRLRRRVRGPDDQIETHIFQDDEVAENANIPGNEEKNEEKSREHPSPVSDSNNVDFTTDSQWEQDLSNQFSPMQAKYPAGTPDHWSPRGSLGQMHSPTASDSDIRNRGNESENASSTPTKCTVCHRETSYQRYRNSDGLPLCSSCGLFERRHGASRFWSLKNDTSKKRDQGSRNALVRSVSNHLVEESSRNIPNSQILGTTTPASHKSNNSEAPQSVGLQSVSREQEWPFFRDEHVVSDEVERLVPEESSLAKEQLEDGIELENLQVPVAEAEHAHLVKDFPSLLDSNWSDAQMLVPEALRWDLEFQAGVWTCTPLQPDIPKEIPLTIGNAPVVLPVEYHWPPMGGINPPPDPRPSAPLDTLSPLTTDVIRDIFLTFEGSVGFYILLSGLLQIIVPDDFDTAWASSHLPHKYGGMKVCYIAPTLEATMLPSTTETAKTKPSLTSPNTSLSSIFRSSRPSTVSASPSLKLNDFIEARPKSNHRKEKYAGRLGLKVSKGSDPHLLMSSHIITEAMLAKSHRETIFGRSRDRFEKLDDDWNKSVEIWAGNENIGTVEKTFDTEAEIYPNGFKHDITLIKPSSLAAIRDVTSPIPDLGWLNHMSWASLRQVTSAVKILGPTESHRSAKSIRSSLQSEILIVGEGIFLNQTEAAGNSKSLRDHDTSTWRTLVSRALLYRVYPDFEPPKGYSGIALYAEGVREDGTQGPGVVGFQSFVQRSGHVQNYAMEGPALERRLQAGRVAFYGAFECPDELKKNYTIV